MLFNVLPIVLIFVAFVIASIVVIRRFPDIRSINVESVPEAKVAATKRRLLVQRLERKLRDGFSSSWQAGRQWGAATQQRLGSLTDRLRTLEDRYRSSTSIQTNESMIEEPAEAPMLEEPTIQTKAITPEPPAEQFYLDAIKQNPKDAEAYRALGELWFQRGQHNEAREALHYALHLKEDATTLAALGGLAHATGELSEAHERYEKAVELDPTNVVHLDRLLDLCILVGRKQQAVATMKKLSAIAPDHPNLSSLYERIAAMPARKRKTAPAA